MWDLQCIQDNLPPPQTWEGNMKIYTYHFIYLFILTFLFYVYLF